MPKIFISYRRHDSAEVTKRLHGRLANEFDSFYDIDSIPPGVDFRKRLSGAVEQSDALSAVIGGGWLDAAYRDGSKQGHRRLDDPDDYVRIEIESALTQVVEDGVRRVLRGGAFYLLSQNVRSATRNYYAPVNRLFEAGFRPARTLR